MNSESNITTAPGEATAPALFTAAQIAAALGIKRQSAQWCLRDVSPSDRRIVKGNESAAWMVSQFPVALRERLAAAATQQQCRTIEALLSMPRQQWQPALPLDKLADDVIQAATKLRDALRPYLVQQHEPNLSAADIEARGIEDYRRVFGNRITARYWRELFMRCVHRDNGAEEWNRLEIFLPDRLKRKAGPAQMVTDALAETFPALEVTINNFKMPHAPDKIEREAFWKLVLREFQSIVRAGQTEKAVARRLRQFLFDRAPFMAASRDALLKSFNRKLEAFKKSNGDLNALSDGRENNGDKVEMPPEDVQLLRTSAAIANGGRIDAAWREEYPNLSEETRRRYEFSVSAPAPVKKIVNRTIVDTQAARHQGKRALRKKCGNITGNWDGIHAMDLWAADDNTANLELAFTNPDGSVSLIQPQIIAVMDCVSSKWVGWAISNDKAPNAELVCGAVLDGIKIHGVPHKLGLENGFVFGKSLNVNGKEDEQGRTLVAGLAQYGCAIGHFEKMNPTSKAELEKSFDTVQRLMERHPGYTGRLQMLDAPEEFKLEQRLIRSGKYNAKDYRYTFEEGIAVISEIIQKYNSTPQPYGKLKGLSPNEAFEALRNHNDPPIQFTPEIEWWLANERYRVLVDPSGVQFSHFGRKIKVRGGQLVNLHGHELWALVDRRDDSMVTFMDLNYTNPFTLEVCKTVSRCESLIAPGSGVLASERAKIREHERAENERYNQSIAAFGNPRKELLRARRNQPPESAGEEIRRQNILPAKMTQSAEQMGRQRAEIRDEKNKKVRRTAANKDKARRMGIPSVLVEDDEQTREALEMLGKAPRTSHDEIES